MITCTLNGKFYMVDFVSARAMREMGPACEMYTKIIRGALAAARGETVEEMPKLTEAMDEMVKWFCILFGNQFTPDEVYDYYPSDRFMDDIALAITAVQNQMTDVLKDFPTKPAQNRTPEI